MTADEILHLIHVELKRAEAILNAQPPRTSKYEFWNRMTTFGECILEIVKAVENQENGIGDVRAVIEGDEVRWMGDRT